MVSNMSETMNRRQVMGIAGAGILVGRRSVVAAEKSVRIGFVGVGKRGAADLRNTLRVPGVEVPAICDINEANLRLAQDIVEEARGKRPEGYSRGLEDFRRMVQREDLDGVITATPWEWHTPVAVAAMKAGKYAAVEVPAALTVQECWDLVNASERGLVWPLLALIAKQAATVR